MATNSPSSPLRYPGGKQCLTPFVRRLIESNGMCGCTYAEPYAGGAGVAMRLLSERVVQNVILNDKCPMVAAFWRALFSQTDSLISLVDKEPVTMETWFRTREITQRYKEFSQLEVAFAFFFQNRTNFSGVIGGGVIGGKNQSGKYKLDARYPKTRLISLMEKVASYRDMVEVCNMDAIAFMEENLLQLGDSCLTYCDPPYFEKGQALYMNAYNHGDHAAVADFLLEQSRNMRWIVSYDNAPQIIELYNRIPLYSFDLPYSAHRVRRGKELLALCPGLVLPPQIEPRMELTAIC